MACIFVKLKAMTCSEDWMLTTQVRNNTVQSIAVYLLKPPQKVLPIFWQDFSGDGWDFVTSSFALDSGQYFNYGFTALHCPLIMQYTSPKVIHDQLTLIFRRQYQYFRYHVYPYRWLMLWMWVNTIACLCEYGRWKTKKSFRLPRNSLLGCTSIIIWDIFANNRRVYCDYEILPLQST
jgi:hypothetical protein